MTWLVGVVLCVVLVESALRMPFAAILGHLHRTSRNAVRIVGTRGISDHWKEKAMGRYAWLTLSATLRLAVLIAILLAIAAIVIWIGSQLADGLWGFVLSWQGIVFTIVVASLYFTARRQFSHG